MISIHEPDAPSVAATHGLNRVTSRQYHDAVLDRPLGDTEQLCQIFVCIMPLSAQPFEQSLPTFMGIHGSSPFLPAPYVECNS